MKKRNEVAEWYKQHNMEYIPSDWGARDPETGEGLENDLGIVHHGGDVGGWFTAQFRQFDVVETGSSNMWRPRGEKERMQIEALDEFFTPYFARLPAAKVNLLYDYLGWRKTQREIGREGGISQQAVSKDLKNAIRALTRLVALDDPDFTPPADGRRRDDAAECEAAERVLNAWWSDRFGGGRL